MTDSCRLCGKPLDVAPSNGTAHLLCRDMFECRVKDLVCARCNKNAIEPDSSASCDECGNDSPFLDYPGPQ